MTNAEIYRLASALEDRLAVAVEKRVVDAVVRRLEPRFEAIDQRFDRLEKGLSDLTELVQGMATGHAKRFEAIERRLDGSSPLELV